MSAITGWRDWSWLDRAASRRNTAANCSRSRWIVGEDIASGSASGLTPRRIVAELDKFLVVFPACNDALGVVAADQLFAHDLACRDLDGLGDRSELQLGRGAIDGAGAVREATDACASGCGGVDLERDLAAGGAVRRAGDDPAAAGRELDARGDRGVAGADGQVQGVDARGQFERLPDDRADLERMAARGPGGKADSEQLGLRLAGRVVLDDRLVGAGGNRMDGLDFDRAEVACALVNRVGADGTCLLYTSPSPRDS